MAAPADRRVVDAIRFRRSLTTVSSPAKAPVSLRFFRNALALMPFVLPFDLPVLTLGLVILFPDLTPVFRPADFPPLFPLFREEAMLPFHSDRCFIRHTCNALHRVDTLPASTIRNHATPTIPTNDSRAATSPLRPERNDFTLLFASADRRKTRNVIESAVMRVQYKRCCPSSSVDRALLS